MTLNEQLLEAVLNADATRVRELVEAGADVNVRCDHGASVLFPACLQGDVEVVRLLLDLGADPNLESAEPGGGIYAEKPLALVMQARHLLDRAKYTPVYDLLVERGATNTDGTVPARWWQFWK